MATPYKSIQHEGSATIEIQKSTFTGYARRVFSDEEAQAFVAEIRSMHPQARHHCSAWIVGPQGLTQRFDDDKEPQGTAGLPILRVLEGQGLTETAIVVVRYFGGVLLGTGGLTRAYGRAATLAIEAGEVVEWVPMRTLQVPIEYTQWGMVENELRTQDREIVETAFVENVQCTFLTEEETVDQWDAYFQSISQGQLTTTDLGITWRAKRLEGDYNES